ncbi:MAG: CamS family sex pheromone protein, partial [Limosilactobacillus sp.]|nr:CamS family sex pheromone protein [Limosilactobacillus sp.]
MKRKLVSLSLVVSLGLLLAACGNSKSKQMTTLSNGSNNTYRTVVVNGKYLVSKSRGVNLDNGNSIMSLKSFDSGLMNVAKQEFAPKTYIFQEGQYLSSHTINQWLARKSGKHPQGLNPAKGSKNNPNPEYLQQIEEQDFMTQSGNQLSLRGMVIGIAVLADGLFRIQMSMDAKAFGIKKWWLILTASIIAGCIGLALIFSP